MKTRLRTYTAYGVSCATVWAVIVIGTQIDGARRQLGSVRRAGLCGALHRGSVALA